MGTRKIVEALKESNQDFEWYPTSKKMMRVIYDDLQNDRMGYSHFSMLDIGAGNGNAFKLLEGINSDLKDSDRKLDDQVTVKRQELRFSKYAIEKSMILIDQFDKGVFLLGTDFQEQTLIDKKMDVVFSNPPFSEYVDWAEKIILESNCHTIYLVIPIRWKRNKRIKGAIDKRFGVASRLSDYGKRTLKSRYTVLGTFSFYDSEYRTSRSKVDVVKISCGNGNTHWADDPFKVWFDTNFKINADMASYDYNFNSKKKEEIRSKLVKGRNLIDRLEELYNADFDKLLRTYKKLEELDYDILDELNVDIVHIRKSLYSKISGLKDLYWKELFDNLGPITNRLTSGSREKLLTTLRENTSIDFTAGNAYAIVIWAIKNANVYLNEQLVDLYLTLSDSENVRNYKSNHRIIDGNWRWVRKEYTHYSLDYRLIHQHYNCFGDSHYVSKINGMNTTTHDLLNDIITIGYNLGFHGIGDTREYEWAPGKQNVFEYMVSDGVWETFMEVRAYKKGSIHLKLNKKFMEKFNIEAGRLLGWIASPKEAVKEMGVSLDTAKRAFGSNLYLKESNVKLLAG